MTYKDEMTLVAVLAVSFNMYFVLFTFRCSLLTNSVESSKYTCLDLNNEVFSSAFSLVA